MHPAIELHIRPGAIRLPGFSRQRVYLSDAEIEQGELLLTEAIHKGITKDDIRSCREYFVRTGGTVYMVKAHKSESGTATQ